MRTPIERIKNELKIQMEEENVTFNFLSKDDGPGFELALDAAAQSIYEEIGKDIDYQHVVERYMDANLDSETFKAIS